MSVPQGLSSAEASLRLQRHGPNEVRREKSKPALLLFLDQFKNHLVLILIAACVLSALLGEWGEVAAIGAILLLNAIIGFVQEYRAETAVQALMGMTAPRAHVIRDGRRILIAAREVVPGDLLLLEGGDLVAADARLVESARLQLNESVLTGESLPVDKEVVDDLAAGSLAERRGSVFMGTSVTAGTATAEVIAVGMDTELGKIAHLITTAESGPTPLQLQLARIGSVLLAICLGVVGCVAVLSLIQGKSWIDTVIFSISLAVAAVPEGLPAIVTVALAIGVQRMADRNALIRKLPSVETLGSVSVICTDKTGTLTTGKMRTRELWGEDHRKLLLFAASCCDAELDSSEQWGSGDPTEIAILIEAARREIRKESIERENPRVAVEPFDSERRRMSIFRADGILYVKGAPESVLSLCVGERPETILAAREAHRDLATRGLRVLAVASGLSRKEEELRLTGLIGIADPPRTEVMQAILEARKAGITPIMITGDHPATAAAIARELGMGDRVHARATPEDKLRLVREWKSRGAIVAMTGDGVNDAPALREAHVGIAMGIAGTEVTRQAADLVLADDNFATIVAAVREGRGVYRNIRKAILYLLTGNFAELAAVLGASVLGLPVPFLAAHLLWINLVTDALPALALIADPVPSDIMTQPPRSVKERILERSQWIEIASVGLLEAVVVLVQYRIQLDRLDVAGARSLTFTTLVFSQLFRAFGSRSRSRIYWEVGVLGNLWLLAVVIVTGALQLALHYFPFGQSVFGLSPLKSADLAWVLGFSLVAISVVELRKIVRRML